MALKNKIKKKKNLKSPSNLEIVKVTTMRDFWELERLEFFEIEVELVVQLDAAVLVNLRLHLQTFDQLEYIINIFTIKCKKLTISITLIQNHSKRNDV